MKMQFARKERSKKSDKEQSLTLFQDQEYDEYWHFKWDQVKRLQEWKERKKWQKIKQWKEVKKWYFER
jgi:hypothetical protein